MLSISVWSSRDGSIRMVFVSTASFSFLWKRDGGKNCWNETTGFWFCFKLFDSKSFSSTQNLPHLQENFLHFLNIRQRITRQIAKVPQLGVQVQHVLPVATVNELLVVVMVGDESPHPLGCSLDIFDVFSPQGSARVALLADRKHGVTLCTLITEDTRDPNTTNTLACFRVTWWSCSSFQVTIAGWEKDPSFI